jgi:SAM-dependent methyltransferase
MAAIESEINRKVFEESVVVDMYAANNPHGPSAQELICLKFVPASHRHSVLDMGIGAGRTSTFLPAEFTQYVGFDYSSRMVEMAKRSFPSLDIRLIDARSFELGQHFDCLYFNGIDFVSPEDRHLILNTVREHTAEGGYFIYRTHNLGFRRVRDWQNNLIAAELRNPGKWPKRLPNRLKYFWKQRQNKEAGWAVVNDSALYFGFLVVYVDIEKEQQLLRRYGFDTIAIIGNNKNEIGFNQDDGWVNIVAKKVN